MLLGSISFSITSSNAASSSAISMVTSPGLSQYGNLVVIGLIILISLREIISSSKLWNIHLNNAFNLAIVPLSLTFIAILVYKVIAII